MSNNTKIPFNIGKIAILEVLSRHDRNPMEMDVIYNEKDNTYNYVLYMGIPPRSFFKNVEKYYRHSNVSIMELLNERSTNLQLRDEFLNNLEVSLKAKGVNLGYVRTHYAKGLDNFLNTSCRDFYDRMDEWYGLIRGTTIFISKMKESVEEIITTAPMKLLDFGRPKCSYCDNEMIKLTITHHLKSDKSLTYLEEIGNDFENLVFTEEMEEKYLGRGTPVDKDIERIRKWFPNHHIVLDFEVGNTLINMACKMVKAPLEEKLEFIRLGMKQVL